jgi:hypothetical protein
MKTILDNMNEVVVVSKMMTTNLPPLKYGGDLEILFINDYYMKLA